MHNIEIRRPRKMDIEKLYQFFKDVIIDTFARENLAELRDDIENELNCKMDYLKSDFTSDGKNRYFLLAVEGEKIVGTIEYGPASDLIDRCTSGELKVWDEVGTVFVHPHYQGQGIGNLLLEEMMRTLQMKGIKEFCLDSGYTVAQKIWKKKFGEPAYLLKDFWGIGNDHMIWMIRLD